MSQRTVTVQFLKTIGFQVEQLDEHRIMLMGSTVFWKDAPLCQLILQPSKHLFKMGEKECLVFLRDTVEDMKKHADAHPEHNKPGATLRMEASIGIAKIKVSAGRNGKG